MENASKALIIAGAILLSILIIALGIFVFNAAKGAVKTDQLDATEKATFNDPISQYEGNVQGSSVKSLLSHLISNAGANKTAGERLPDIKYVDNAGQGPTFNLAINPTTYKIGSSGGNFNIESTVANTQIEAMSQLRKQISNSHTYDVEVGFNDATGLIDEVIITY